MSEVGFRVGTEKLAVGVESPRGRDAEAGLLARIFQNFVKNVFSIDFADGESEAGQIAAPKFRFPACCVLFEFRVIVGQQNCDFLQKMANGVRIRVPACHGCIRVRLNEPPIRLGSGSMGHSIPSCGGTHHSLVPQVPQTQKCLRNGFAF
jgi:hypothetical protein